MNPDNFKKLLDELFITEMFGAYGLPPNEDLLSFITEVFLNIESIGKDYPIDALANGLYEIANASSYCMMPILDNEIELSKRLACINAMENIFSKIFAIKCDNIPTSQSKTANRINMTCYMWWDIFPTEGSPEKIELREIDNALLNLMQRILKLDSIPCQESALHGLSHWSHNYPKRTLEIIESNKNTHTALKEYAEFAKSGSLQ